VINGPSFGTAPRLSSHDARRLQYSDISDFRLVRDAADLEISEISDLADFVTIWRDINAARQAKRWTLARLAREVTRVSGQSCSKTTVHDRIRHGRRVSWSEGCWFVRALGLDEAAWRKRWTDAENSRHTDTDTGQPNPAGEPGRRWPWRPVAVAAAILAAILIAVLSWLLNREQTENGDPVACAIVTVDKAGVFPAPADPNPLTTKNKGDKVTLPRDGSEVTGPDGRRYRIVRTPTRTPSGHAYMLADNINLVPC
jgi:hypothetical protein